MLNVHKIEDNHKKNVLHSVTKNTLNFLYRLYTATANSIAIIYEIDRRP